MARKRLTSKQAQATCTKPEKYLHFLSIYANLQLPKKPACRKSAKEEKSERIREEIQSQRTFWFVCFMNRQYLRVPQGLALRT
jgi:hypothetical protein